ncbi:MAG: SRPBCC domain-containing protein, partial [Polaromonas sp.]|nr:SRPBCC domain-containing protein [Polaromonas sp.]
MSANDTAFFITRVFKAPRDRVWQAWSNAASLQQWWGPQGCTVEALRFEFRPGGFFHYAMKFDGAPTWWGRFNYREVVSGERIVWLNSFANAECG